MEGKEITRRTFLKSMALGTTGLLIFPQCSFQSGSANWRVFSGEEADLMDAIVEQIIPTDEWMGAKDAGVTNYIDKQLTSHLSRCKENYKKGLKAVRLTCKEVYDTPFEKLPWDEQTKFLTRMQNGEFSALALKTADGAPVWEEGEDRSFFNLVRDHTMQGFYGSPRHGGNKDYVSYKMIGLDYPVIEGQNRYD